jgi:hypothetical protein
MTTYAKLLTPIGAASAILSSTIAAAAAPYGSYELCHSHPQYFYVDHLGTKSERANTVPVARTQASSTWADWIWRGKSVGAVQFCQKNSISCPFLWLTHVCLRGFLRHRLGLCRNSRSSRSFKVVGNIRYHLEIHHPVVDRWGNLWTRILGRTGYRCCSSLETGGSPRVLDARI